MAIDDPLDALQKQLELEESSSSSIGKILIEALEASPKGLFIDAIIRALAEAGRADDRHKTKVLIDTLVGEVRRLGSEVDKLRSKLSPMEFNARTEAASRLLLDAFRKAMVTRAVERVKRIATILANGIVDPRSLDEDEIEEMMRVATELTDQDVDYLRELVLIEGNIVRLRGRIERYQAHMQWEQGPWGTKVEGQIDSVFSKLESCGLVSRIPPPNNLNIGADFQNRYVLLSKGLRFTELIQQEAATSN
jgi:hypothetical protein